MTVSPAGTCFGRCAGFAVGFGRRDTARFLATFFQVATFLTDFFAATARLARRFDFFALARREDFAFLRAAMICPPYRLIPVWDHTPAVMCAAYFSDENC